MQKVKTLAFNPFATHLCAFIFGCILLKAISANAAKLQTSLRQNVLFQLDGIPPMSSEAGTLFLGTSQNCVLSDAPVRLVQNSEHPIYMTTLSRSVEILKIIQEYPSATLRWFAKKDAPYTLCYESPKVIYGSF